jgi:hypothetical protein
LHRNQLLHPSMTTQSTLARTISFSADIKPPVHLSPDSTMSSTKTGRRRRSSSIIYQEPPESLEQISDQSALPNLNSQWVNAKGGYILISQFLPPSGVARTNTDLYNRGLDHTLRPHHWPQDLLRHSSWRNARDIVDSHQHHLHVWVLSHVPLGPRRAVRVQRWRI